MRSPFHRVPEASPDARTKARRQILKAANRYRGNGRQPLSMRRIEWAVCIVRRHQLVDRDVLEAAGFRRSSR